MSHLEHRPVQRYLCQQLRIVVWDVVQHCISKGSFERGFAIGWTASKRSKQVQAGSNGGLH